MEGKHGSEKGGVDVVLERVENAAKKFETTHDLITLPTVEKDLLQHLCSLREALESALQDKDGSSLQNAFGGDCSRIGRARALLEGLRFDDDSEAGECKQQTLTKCKSVERELESMGLGEKLKQAQERERAALFERIRKELEREAQADEEDEFDKMSEVWDDHPGSCESLPAVSFAAPAPADIAGHLWKKSPSPLTPIKQWKWRWISLSKGKLKWYMSEADGKSDNRRCMRGEIDFSLNPCNVALDDQNESQFIVRPQSGTWILGSFTGADTGREFYFDCHASEYDRKKWVDAISQQMRHGGQAYGGTRLSFMGK
mmetsp:Transcript_108299/g.169360  ORF Transcript_108299/g.169360 Transcript_108299/m.169360 type:complete len:315 (+) Transcript_108299:97-1041(+)